MTRRDHWEQIYHTRSATSVSWHQEAATLSLALIEGVAPDRRSAIVDVGGGASSLVDGLVHAGYARVTVLDLAHSALAQARARLGARGESATWVQADALDSVLTESSFDVWHDRAVFHFLTDSADRARYRNQVLRAVHPSGYVVMAVFALEGPERCSGLPVARYSAETLAAELGRTFQLERELREAHETPAGVIQPFVYCVFRRT